MDDFGRGRYLVDLSWWMGVFSTVEDGHYGKLGPRV